MKVAYLFAPIMEYSANIRFSVFLNYLKKNKFYDKLVVVCFEKIISIFPDADEFISISDDFLKKTNSNFPNILEVFDRNNSQFHSLSLDYIKSIKKEEDEILFWDDYNVKNEINENVYEEFTDNNPFIISPEFGTVDPLGSVYRRDFTYLKDMLSNNFLLSPTTENYKKIKEHYKKYFINENTVILITRNFTNKQPEANTDIIIPNIKNFVSYLIENKITVLNIGVPPCRFGFDSEFYYEIDDDLTQEDLLSLMYLSKYTLLNFVNAGYQTHAICGANIMKISYEFQNDYIYEGRKNNKKLLTEDVTDKIKNNDFDGIANIIKSSTIPKNLFFSNYKPIIFLDKI